MIDPLMVAKLTVHFLNEHGERRFVVRGAWRMGWVAAARRIETQRIEADAKRQRVDGLLCDLAWGDPEAQRLLIHAREIGLLEVL